MENTKKILEQILRNAGKRMIRRSSFQVLQKEGHGNFVTTDDLAIQNELVEGLSAWMPSAKFYMEEDELHELTDEPTFVIDPIDGTTNYIRGRCCSAISVALLQEKQAVVAAVYDPYCDRFYFAQKGKGAFCNDIPLRVSNMQGEEAIVTFGTSPHHPEYAEQTLMMALKFLKVTGDIRRSGSAVLDLCDVAAGRTDMFFEMLLQPWDYAAGGLLVQEAGGIFQGLNGSVTYDKPCGVMACSNVNYKLAKEFLGL